MPINGAIPVPVPIHNISLYVLIVLKVEGTIWYFNVSPLAQMKPSALSITLVNNHYQIEFVADFFNSYLR
jgi:hypothetical protein